MVAAIISMETWRDRARRLPERGWANDELAECFRVVDLLSAHGMLVSIETGISDEGDPWAVFIREDTQDVIIHIARIGGSFTVSSVACPATMHGASLREILEEAVRTQPLVLPRNSANGDRGVLLLHPTTLLAAFIAAAFAFVSQSAPVMAGEASDQSEHTAAASESDTELPILDVALAVSGHDPAGGWSSLPFAETIPVAQTHEGPAEDKGLRQDAAQHLLRASLVSAVTEPGVRTSSWDSQAAITQVAVMVSAAITAQLMALSKNDVAVGSGSQPVTRAEMADVVSETLSAPSALQMDATLAPDRPSHAASAAFAAMNRLAQPVNESFENLAASASGSGLAVMSYVVLAERAESGSGLARGAADHYAWERTDWAHEGVPSDSEFLPSVAFDRPFDRLGAQRSEPVRAASGQDMPTLASMGARSAIENAVTAVSRDVPATQTSEVTTADARPAETTAGFRSSAASFTDLMWVDWLRMNDGSVYNAGRSFLASISAVSGPDLLSRAEKGDEHLRVAKDVMSEDGISAPTESRGEADGLAQPRQEDRSPDGAGPEPADLDDARPSPTASDTGKTADIVQTMFKILGFAKASETLLALDSAELGFLKLFVQNAPRLHDVERILVFEGKGTPESVFMLMPGIAMVSQHVLPEWVLLDEGETDIQAPYAQTLTLSQDSSIELIGVVPLFG